MSEIYTDPPQSRNEAIIKSTIDGTQYTAPPQSRMEDLLLELKEAIEQGGGGGGTSDYSQLSNKPSINDVTLSGNKTASDLGLMPHYDVDEAPTESSENLITSGAVWSADKNINDKLQGSKVVEGNPITVTDAEAMNAESVKVDLEPKQDLHGYDKPWAGGAGKNKLPLVLADIKTANTSGTWSGNTYTLNGVTFEILTDSADNVLGVKVNGTATERTILYIIRATNNYHPTSGSYIVNKSYQNTYTILNVDGYNNNTWVQSLAKSSSTDDVQFTVDYSEYDRLNIYLELLSGYAANNITFYPMIRLSTESDADFEPYSNICPISGYSEVNIENNTDTYTIDLDGTKYGGILDVTEGGYSDEWGYISGSSVSDLTSLGALTASIGSGLFGIYFPNFSEPHDSSVLTPITDLICNELPNVIPSVQWEANANGISINNQGHIIFTVKDITTQADMDTWLSNNPIQIAYRKKTPSSVSTTPTDIPLLENTNNISSDGTNITLKYQPNNVIGECKAYTDEKCAKVLPQPPTTDGTYHLECSVSGGISTIRWVLNS